MNTKVQLHSYSKSKVGIIVFSFILIGFVFISSCKKDTKTAPVNASTPDSPPAQRTVWVIDTTDHTMSIIKKPAFKIKVDSWGGSSRSLDIDGDSIPDLIFSNPYTYFATRFFYGTRVLTLNNDTYILADSLYAFDDSDCGISSVHTMDSLFPRPLSYKDSIHLNGRWRHGNLDITSYLQQWELPPSTCTHISRMSSSWPYPGGYNYIAIKCKGKIAWIKVYSDQYQFQSLSYYELAVTN